MPLHTCLALLEFLAPSFCHVALFHVRLQSSGSSSTATLVMHWSLSPAGKENHEIPSSCSPFHDHLPSFTPALRSLIAHFPSLPCLNTTQVTSARSLLHQPGVCMLRCLSVLHNPQSHQQGHSACMCLPGCVRGTSAQPCHLPSLERS